MVARPVGQATMLLGAGRARMESPVDHAVGVIVNKKVGDTVAIGEPLCTLFVNDESRLEDAQALIRGAYAIGPGPAVPGPLIVERITVPGPGAPP
jgi:thymidine phosphorylase